MDPGIPLLDCSGVLSSPGKDRTATLLRSSFGALLAQPPLLSEGLTLEIQESYPNAPRIPKLFSQTPCVPSQEQLSDAVW